MSHRHFRSIVRIGCAVADVAGGGTIDSPEAGVAGFFRQQRPGLHGKPFYMIKFCAMSNAKDEQGNLLPNEERLTRFGHFLRKTSQRL